jgi:AraC-like DNA-binding protein
VNRGNLFTRITEPAPQSPTAVSPLAQQVLDLMEQERAYATERLTLDSLARQLRTQPYRLRKVINGELGYRNFNTFINLYRVKEVAARMALPEYADTPLLTLALDAGFRSLAPFNRSFREYFQVTPSAYRASLE